MTQDRARHAVAWGGFGTVLALVTGATLIGVGIVAALGAALGRVGYRTRR